MVTKQAVNQMREILSGIVLGRLEHDQGSWHCGTAHCVAGWNTVLNHRELYFKELAKQLEEKDGVEEGDLDAWGINSCGEIGRIYWDVDAKMAREDWGLTQAEADMMFDGCAGLPIQIALIEYLADGNPQIQEREDVYEYDHDIDGTEEYPDENHLLWQYQARYEDEGERRKWALKHDTTPRSESGFVKELLCGAKPASVLEQVLEVETIKLGG